jgi:UTP--glucose-1-phosphate uridylyltransferase
MKIKKAVIPAAGLGTRFLPATKSVPKEMLTIVDAPIIFYVVEEAINAGIEDIVLIQGRGKTAIEDFFDTSYELEDKLQKDKKYHLLDRLTQIRNMANIISIRQKQPLGLGHAVLCAKPVVGDDPFAVLLGDEIMLPKSNQTLNALGQLCEQFEAQQCSTVAVMKVADSDVKKYGIADIPEDQNQFPAQVRRFLEKPNPNEIKSRWALPGRYTFTYHIFEELKNSKPGALGELQLTDAMNSLAQKMPFYGYPTASIRYDAGDKLGYLVANIEFALRHPELSQSLKEYIQNSLNLK